MVTRNINEHFKVVVSTKKTLFGASSDKFKVYYAPVDNLTDKIAIDGGLTEIVETVENPRTATTTAMAYYGSRRLFIDSANSTLQEGDVIEYASGKYAYVMKIVGDKLYLKTPIRANIPAGTTLTQVGHSGVYVTPDIAISDEGEYIVAIEGSEFGVMVEQRVKVVDPTAGEAVDGDAPEEAVAVAY